MSASFDLWNIWEYERNGLFLRGGTVSVLLIFFSRVKSQLTSSIGGKRCGYNGMAQSNPQPRMKTCSIGFSSVMAFSLFWFIVVNNLFLAWPVMFDLWRRMFSRCCYEPSLNSGFLASCIPRKY